MLGKEIAAILEDINSKIVENFHSAHEITIKSDESIVTKTDREVEAILIPRLKQILPESKIIGEESAPNKPDEIDECFKHDYLWAVDPIDGTTNFASGIPNFTVSIGLLKRTESGYVPVTGCISFPALHEIYYTTEHSIVRKNLISDIEIEIQHTDRASVSSILLPNHLAQQMNLNQDNRFIGNIRFMGSTAADLLYVSLGKAAATCTIAHIWDIAAGFAIAKTQGLYPKDLANGQQKISLTKDDFYYGNEKINWQLKNPLVLSSEGLFKDVQNLLHQK